MLRQVLAVSDIIIYRTRADRLHNDLFTFLGNASVAFQRHFSCELKTAAERFQLNDIAVSSLCPAVIIYHETQYTEPLKSGTNYFYAVHCATEMGCLSYLHSKQSH